MIIERDFVFQLRLGNAIMYKGQVCYIEGISLDTLDENEPYIDIGISMGKVDYGIVPHHQKEGDLLPIELTPELLDKMEVCGGKDFIELSHACFLTQEHGTYYLQTEYDTLGKIHQTELPVKYLHQLQNLFYALTGTELSITL